MLGLLYVFTGNGKGKTTAAIGMAVRAAGHGQRCVIVQFLKQGDYGETRCPLLEFYQYGRSGFVTQSTPEDRRLVERGLAKAAQLLKEQPFLLVLDEINVVISLGLAASNQLLSLLEQRGSTHVILTGRGAPQVFLEAADLVTDMRKIKHPYDRGTQAILGLEF